MNYGEGVSHTVVTVALTPFARLELPDEFMDIGNCSEGVANSFLAPRLDH